jgi:hypothetical protein
MNIPFRRRVTAATIAFSNPNIITDSGNRLGIFQLGDRIQVAGSTKNDGSFTLDRVSTGSIHTRETTIQTEDAGAKITITRHKKEEVYMATRAERKDRLDQIVSQNFTAAWLAFLTTIGFFSLIAALLLVSWSGLPQEGVPTKPGGTTVAGGVVATVTQGPFHDLLNTLVGIVGTAWATIVGFYFGSSAGSRQQTETLSQVALAHNPPAPSSPNRSVTAATIAFTNPNIIADSGNRLGIFQLGDRIQVAGSTQNNGSFTIDRISAGSIHTRETIQTEGAGAMITITAL